MGNELQEHPTLSPYELDYENFLRQPDSEYIRDFLKLFNLNPFHFMEAFLYGVHKNNHMFFTALYIVSGDLGNYIHDGNRGDDFNPGEFQFFITTSFPSPPRDYKKEKSFFCLEFDFWMPKHCMIHSVNEFDS